MLKTEIVLGQELASRGKGRATVIDLMPTSKFYVKVRYTSGVEENAAVEKLKPLPPPKLTPQERFFNQVSLIRQTPLSYYLAGWIAASHETIFLVSAPPKDLDKTIEDLDAHGVDYVLGQTLKTKPDQLGGRTFTVRTAAPDKALSDRYSTETGVNCTVYFELATGMVSINAKEFVLGFLLDELRFKLGKKQDQDLTLIRSRVPAERMPDFEAGFAAA